jgi:hypothetical protein
MKRRVVAALLASAALPVQAAEAVSLKVRETASLAMPGASAAFAVDADMVDASVDSGRLVLRARRAGRTPVTVIGVGGVQTLTVVVEAAPGLALPAPALEGQAGGAWNLSVDSAAWRIGSALSLTFPDRDRTLRLQLQAVHEGGIAGTPDHWALPSASIVVDAPGRSLVLLDAPVEGSALGAERAVVRGVHWRDGGLALHAGIASASPADDLLLPRRGERLVSVSRSIEAHGLQITPAARWLPDSRGRAQAALSLGIERGGDDSPLRLKAELGWSGGPGVALDASLRGPRRQARLNTVLRPRTYAALAAAGSAGGSIDGAWWERFGERTSATVTLSASRLDDNLARHDAGSGRLELRHETGRGLSVTAGLSGGGYRRETGRSMRRRALSLGLAYDAADFGASILYRQQHSTGHDGGTGTASGQGVRFALRASQTPWKAGLFVDAQRQEPTLDLLWRERPDLARAYEDVGGWGGTPEDVVRRLREQSALLAVRGVSVGTLRLSPLRLQGGLDLVWRSGGPARAEIGARWTIDDVREMGGGRRARTAMLHASRRLFRNTELKFSVTHASLRRAGGTVDSLVSFQLALNMRFSTLELPGHGRRPITGQVLRGDVLVGDDGSGGVAVATPLADVDVVLDGHHRTRSDSEGRFTFEAPGSGLHRVQVVLPSTPGAYFASPSVLTLGAGATVRFAISFAAARLAGRVLSDAQLPLAGVTVRLETAARGTLTATTDSSGSFEAPVGDARLVLAADSVPPGHDLAGLAEIPVQLAAGKPVTADVVVRAQRSIEGQVAGLSAAPATVVVQETGRRVTADARTGRFVLRGLPAGRLTLVAEREGRRTEAVVEVPQAAGKVTGVVLRAP